MMLTSLKVCAFFAAISVTLTGYATPRLECQSSNSWDKVFVFLDEQGNVVSYRHAYSPVGWEDYSVSSVPFDTEDKATYDGLADSGAHTFITLEKGTKACGVHKTEFAFYPDRNNAYVGCCTLSE